MWDDNCSNSFGKSINFFILALLLRHQTVVAQRMGNFDSGKRLEISARVARDSYSLLNQGSQIEYTVGGGKSRKRFFFFSDFSEVRKYCNY